MKHMSPMSVLITFAISWKHSLIFTNTVFLVNLDDASVCQLPSYPGFDYAFNIQTGPIILQYSEEQQKVFACGNARKITYGEHECYSLSSGSPKSWEILQKLTSLSGKITFKDIKSHYLNSFGWLVFGRGEEKNGVITNTSLTKLFAQNKWNDVPTTIPYELGYYPKGFCSVQMNNTHVILLGGSFGNTPTNSAWILDLTDYTWAKAADMLYSDSNSHCFLIDENEVLLSGSRKSQIYNPASNTWRDGGSYPLGSEYNKIFLWQNKLLSLRSNSDRIFLMDLSKFGFDSEWGIVLNATLGADFNYYHIPHNNPAFQRDTAILVPRGLFKC